MNAACVGKVFRRIFTIRRLHATRRYTHVQLRPHNQLNWEILEKDEREREERKKSMRNKRFKVFINWMDLYGAGKKNGKPITSFFFVQAAIFLVTVFYYINISHKRVCNFSIYLIQFVRDQIPSGWWAPAT